MQSRGSCDLQVAAAGIEIQTGRKWNASRELEVAEAQLTQKALVGAVVTGRAGLSYIPGRRASSGKGKVRYYLLQGEVQAGVEEVQDSKLGQNGKMRCSEKSLEQTSGNHIRFLVQAVYGTIPSPGNLQT